MFHILRYHFRAFVFSISSFMFYLASSKLASFPKLLALYRQTLSLSHLNPLPKNWLSVDAISKCWSASAF